jgi:DNA-binding NarL/FixJ family response regulator
MSQHESERQIAVLVSIAEPILHVGVCTALAGVADLQIIDADHVSVDGRVDVVVADSSTAARFVQDSARFSFHESLQLSRILVISAHAREYTVRNALQRGIHGFVLTSSPVRDLLAGVRALSRGGNYLCPSVARLLTQVSQRDVLTSREDEVLRLLTMGLCNKSIARNLEIAVGTVKTHVKSIMSKLDANCRTEAARIATERGLIDVPDT